MLVADEPELSAACTTALLARDREVRALRDRIGAQIHRRITDALGDDRDEAVVRALDLAYSGAMLQAGTGHLAYDEIGRPPGRGRGVGDHGVEPMIDVTDRATRGPSTYSPYDYEVHEDPYPTYARLRERGAAVPQRRARLLGAVAPRRRDGRVPGLDDLLERPRGHPRPPRLGTPRPQDHVVPGHGPAPSHPHACPGLSGFHAAPGARPRAARSASSPSPTSSEAIESGSFDLIGDFAGKLPMDVISELMGVPVADRDELRRLADLLVHRDEGRLRRPAGGHRGGAGARRLLRRHDRRAPRADPTDDLTSALLVAEIDGDRLDDDEIVALPVPHGGGRQRDHHQAPGQRLVLGLAQPGAARPGRARRPPRSTVVGRGDAALRHIDPDAGPARDRVTSRCTAVSSRRASGCCCSSARPTATSRCSTDPDRYDLAARHDCPAGQSSASAATSAWARPWPASRPASRSVSWSNDALATTSISIVPVGSTRSTSGDSPRCRPCWRPRCSEFPPHPDRRGRGRHRCLVGHRRGDRAGAQRCGPPGDARRPPHGHLEKVAASIRDAGGEAYAAELDVTDDDSVRSFLAEAERAMGGVEILVSNAGAMSPESLAELDTDRLRCAGRASTCSAHTGSVAPRRAGHDRAAAGRRRAS